MGAFEANVSVGIGLSLPSVSFTLSDCASLSTNLNAALALLPGLQALLLNASVGIFSYAYAGTGDTLGAAVTSALSSTWGDGTTPTSGSCTALVFGLVDDVALSPPNLPTQKYSAYLSGLTFGGSGLIYGGKLTLASLVASLTTDCFSQATPILNAQLAATASLQASLALPQPTLAETLVATISAAGNLTAVPLPTATISASAAIMANLTANFGALITFGGIVGFDSAKAYVYLYTGAANALGAALTTALTTEWGDSITGHVPSSGACSAVLLGATDTLSVTALTSFFSGA
jgi:hypothetical protein